MPMETNLRARPRDKLLRQMAMEMHRLIDRDVEVAGETTIDKGTITVRKMLLATMPQVIQTREEAVRVASHPALSLPTMRMRMPMGATMRENNAGIAAGDLVWKTEVHNLPAKNLLTRCYKEWKSSTCKTTRMTLDTLALGHIDTANRSKLEVF